MSLTNIVIAFLLLFFLSFFSFHSLIMSVPNDYKSAPSWPSLYWPFQPGYNPLVMVADKEHSLYYINGIHCFCLCCIALTPFFIKTFGGLQ